MWTLMPAKMRWSWCLPDVYKRQPEYSCVEYLGYIGRQELAQVYARSSIGMSTILNVGQYASLDNFPTKVYEYMAAGLPVIVSDYPFMRRSVQQDDFGIAVDPADVQAVAQAIGAIPVSYTHLDVYKRQDPDCAQCQNRRPAWKRARCL